MCKSFVYRHDCILTRSTADLMIPSYTHAFDVVISNDATSTGAVPTCTDTETNCHKSLVGVTSCPAGKDTSSPWPPYANNGAYLFTNPDGDDPTSPNGQRTFQPYWTEFVPASQAPAISYAAPANIKTFSDDDLLKPISIAGGGTFPASIDDIPRIAAGATTVGDGMHPEGDPSKGLPVTQKYVPMSISGAGGVVAPGGNGTTTMGGGNGTITMGGGSTVGGSTGGDGTVAASSSATKSSTKTMRHGTRHSPTPVPVSQPEQKTVDDDDTCEA